MNQISNLELPLKIGVESKIVHAAFMDLKKAYERVGWTAMCNVLKVRIGGKSEKGGIKTFY